MKHQTHRLPSTVTVVLILTGILYFAQSATAQPWQFLTGSLFDIAYGPDDTRLIVGEYGIVMRSEGEEWSLPHSHTYRPLRGVAFVGDDDAVIVGDEGYVAWSRDRGSSWLRREVPGAADAGFFDVTPIGSTGAVIASAEGAWFTEDAGVSWDRMETPDVESSITVLRALSLDTVVIGIAGSGLYRTVDRGESWTLVHGAGEVAVAIEEGESYLLAGLADGSFLRSMDRGSSWSGEGLLRAGLLTTDIALLPDGGVVAVGLATDPGRQRPPRLVYVSDIANTNGVWEEDHVFDASSYFYPSAVTADRDGGWTLVSPMSHVMHYPGGGEFRRTTISETNFWTGAGFSSVTGISFADSNTGLAHTGGTGLCRTTNGGVTWRRTGFTTTVSGLHFFEGGHGVWLSSSSPMSIVYETMDAGKTWVRREGEVDGLDSSVPVFFWHDNGRNGYSLKSQLFKKSISEFYQRTFYYYTRDTGRSYVGRELEDSTRAPVSYTFSDGGFGAIVTGDHPGIEGSEEVFRLYRTVDGLETLEVVAEIPETPREIDNWRTLKAHSPGRLFRGEAIDDTNYTESRMRLLESTDGGESWESFGMTFDYPVTLSFLADSLWVATAAHENIWLSYDAGATWVSEKLDSVPPLVVGGRAFPVNLSEAILLDDERTIMIRGTRGVILRKVSDRRLADVAVEERKYPEATTSPNPAGAETILRWSTPDVRTIDLYGIEGERVQRTVVASGQQSHRLDLTRLPSGIYQAILRDGSGEGRAMVRVLVRR